MKLIYLAAFSLFFHPFASIGEERQARLVIDPRGHSGSVNDLIFTPDGLTLISLGSDKAIRFWDVESGDLRDTLRLEVRDGSEGKLYAGAVSPDGRWLAVGGYPIGAGKDGSPFYLIDLETNQIAAVLLGHGAIISSIDFSDDGKWLASGSGDYSIRVWNLDGVADSAGGGSPVEITDSQKLKGHVGIVDGVDFSPGGDQLVSTAGDHRLFLWQRGDDGLFKPDKAMKKHTDKAKAVSFSPDGQHIVSAGYDHRLLLWDGRNGNFLRALEEDMEAHVSTVAFSPDGELVLASSDSSRAGYSAVYAIGTGERTMTFTDHDNRVFASAWHPSGATVATSGGNDKDIYLWRPASGEVVHHLRGSGRSGLAVGFAKKGGVKVAFGQTKEGPGLLGNYFENSFDFTTLTLTALGDPQSAAAEFGRVSTRRNEAKLEKTDSYQLQTGSGEIVNDRETQGRIHSFSFTPDGDVVVGSDFSLRLCSSEGRTLRSFIGHEGAVWALSPSSDGRYLATASGDQTIRLWNPKTGDLLVSLFHARDGEWVCWTPDGYFAASPDGGKYIGWHFNKGIQKMAGYLSGEQLFGHFYRPDIVTRSISEIRPSSEIVAELGLKFDLETALRGAPSVAITEPAPNSTSPNRRQRFLVEGIDNGGGVAEIRLFNADKRIPADGPGSLIEGKWVVPFTVSLSSGENEIRAVSVNPEGIESVPDTIKVKFAGETATSRLHLVAVGLNEYKNPRFALDFCRPDVDAFAKSLVDGSDTLFSEIFVHKLFDDGATRPAIETKMKEIASQAAPDDVFVFVFAGHGVMSEGSEGISPEFHLVLHEVTQMYGNDEALAELALPGSILEELTAAIPARKQLMVLDSCQSGGLVDTFAMRGVAEEKAIAQLSRATGMHVLASTRTEQFATEAKELGHGLFTYALLEALSGKGDGNDDGRITVKEVEAFLNNRVPELSEEYTGAAQYPNSFGRGQDFPIGLVK